MAAAFHPLIETWFERHFSTPTEPQVLGWPQIRAGRDVLIAAPTGSGKTLAAFLFSLDEIVRRAAAGDLGDETLVVYVSPLKALTNDVRKNLETPLGEIRELAAESGLDLGAIRTAVRTGDTPASERARMLRAPAHVLVTTPESLFILLTAERSRAALKAVRTIIVDEIHAVAGDKRGAHLALSLARLDHLVTSNGGQKPQRVGLSATVKPIKDIAAFLSPTTTIVDVGHRREMTLSIALPEDELAHVASNELWADVYDRIADLIGTHRTTLVFVGTRRLSERVAFALTQRLGEGIVVPHHGSLARATRHDAETRLKEGALRAVVATASLELGIDIGSVDLVVQIGSPRSIGVALQRIGRSGHWVGAKPEGVLFATTRDELIECAALVRAIRSGNMDRLCIPASPFDILAQQLVAACASTEEWREDDLFALVRSTYPYAALVRADFDAVLTMLADGIATSRGRSGTFLHRDRVNGRVRARRGARMAAIMSGGAIPDRADYAVVAEPDNQQVGTLDEDFAIESMAGDIFLLGQTSWRIRRVEANVVRVENAHGAPPSVPFWNGEGLGRTIELSTEVARLRVELDERDDEAAYALLERQCGLDRGGAQQALMYVRAGKAALGVVPSDTTIVAERFFDEGGGMQLVVHAPFGARINRAWGLALRKRFCRSFNLELQAAATDNGIVISLSEQHAFPLDAVFAFVKAASVDDVLTQALLPAPMFGARWRWNVTRALAVLRMRNGRKVPPQLIRMRSDDLLAAVFPDQAACPENLSGPVRIPDHVLVRETIGNCLHEAMDLDGFKAVLGKLERGELRTVAVETPTPSPFSHEILNANPYAYLDDAPLEERRARAVQLRSVVGSHAADGIGLLDATAIAEVAAESWPTVRDADELHDALLTLVALAPVEPWRAYFEALQEQRRATTVRVGAATFWVSAERLSLFAVVHPGGAAEPAIAGVDPAQPLPATREAALAEIVRGWLESSGPQTAGELAIRFACDEATVESALLQLETEGQVLRGHFHSRAQEWCNRRVLARIHRRTLGTLRREIEPVTTVEFVRFLFHWQHATPRTRLHGVDGTLHVIRQLEGLEVAAAAWETQVLPRRVAGYKPDYLDKLCQSGEIMWGRLSPHPALVSRVDGEGKDLVPDPAGAAKPHRRKIRPTKLVPISLFAREGAETLVVREAVDEGALSHAACDVLAAIRRRGAPFFTELVRDTRRLPSEIEEALWELVAAGLVAADGFDALRALADPKRRLGEKARSSRPRSSSGRWTTLVAERTHVDVEAFARRLLARYGVVLRDIIKREPLAPPWRELLAIFRRMEAQGEIRGGRFVGSFIGEQFALPQALDALRAIRRSGATDETLAAPSVDPLHVAFAMLPRPAGTSAVVPELAAAQ
ncbi:MAG: DEAD/DEAH box helicase [Candidatus Eremiobacteraeota bacterium]|nr:DEAD/DEAH box helicase [Candidatus Eremiobacteraeota bacterium]MBC5802080.1 DEAD/DEAH box helicase [Candidatus Eremiobacteraeota bacterium]